MTWSNPRRSGASLIQLEKARLKPNFFSNGDVRVRLSFFNYFKPGVFESTGSTEWHPAPSHLVVIRVKVGQKPIGRVARVWRVRSNRFNNRSLDFMFYTAFARLPCKRRPSHIIGWSDMIWCGRTFEVYTLVVHRTRGRTHHLGGKRRSNRKETRRGLTCFGGRT